MEPKKYIDHLTRRGLSDREARRKIQRWLDKGVLYLDRKMHIRVWKSKQPAPIWP